MTQLPILDSRCVTCDAGGWVTNPLWREFHRKQSAAGLKRSDPDYWDGEPDQLEEIPCGVCDGLGRILTSEGRRLLDFLTLYGVVKIDRNAVLAAQKRLDDLED